MKRTMTTMRYDDGSFQVVVEDRPTEAEIEAAKAAASADSTGYDGVKGPGPGARSTCAACGTAWLSFRVTAEISATGVCNELCAQFVRGERAYVTSSRLPTLAEAVDAVRAGKPGRWDYYVLAQQYAPEKDPPAVDIASPIASQE